MKYRKIGSLDWNVSALGFGCMRLPSRKLNRLRANTDASIRLIRYGIDQGINYIDTAYLYHLGDSEKILGQALQDGYRECVRLATKLPMFLTRKTEDFDRYLHKQLKRLQTDHIDIYLFHNLNSGQFEKVKQLGLMEKMKEAKEKGLINYIGLSFHDTFPTLKKIIDFYDWDMVQIQYNYMDIGIQATTEGLTYAHSQGIAVVIMEPLKGGKLANPPSEALELMKSAKPDRSPVDWALQFLWNRPEVSVVLSGMGSKKMVDENCASADHSGIHSLSKEDENTLAEIADIYRKKILVPCTTCEYCMPCPEGVNIPQNFAIVNNIALDKSLFQRWQMKKAYKKLTESKEKLDKTNPNGNASTCIQCGVCLEKCPQNINIPEELKKVHAIMEKGRKISEYYQQ